MDLTQTILPASNLILAEIGIEPATVRSVRQAYQRTHYQAALNWLIRYTPESAENELTQVQGLLEAFHHLCTINALQPASRLLTLTLNTATQEELHNQLYTWGYCQEQVKLYESLLGKLDAACDSIILNGLGLAHRTLGNYDQAVTYYSQSVTYANALHDLEGEGIALCNVGNLALHNRGMN
jgi:tetratricopeptide (TPR) repeat protein